MCEAPYRNAELHTITICSNRRGSRRFCGARLCEPQHVGSDHGAGFINTLGGPNAPAGHRPPVLWLRLRRAALYRRVALCEALGNSGLWYRSRAPPTASRRYGRLKICATTEPPRRANPNVSYLVSSGWMEQSTSLFWSATCRPGLDRHLVVTKRCEARSLTSCFRRAGSPAERASCPCHPTTVKYSG